MVAAFVAYLGQVLKRSFTGIFIVVDLLGLILLVLSLNQPKVPIVVSIAVFAIIFIVSSFVVWDDVERNNKRLRTKIAGLKDGIPKYTVKTGAFERFSIAKLVDKTVTELEGVQAKLRPEPQLSTSALAATDSLNNAFKVLSQFSVNLPRLIVGGETLEEQEERLVRHLEKLGAFEAKLEKTYRLPLFFEATRSDGNVELKIEASPASVLIVEDDYVRHKLPKTYTPSPYRLHDFSALSHVSPGGFANRLYSYSYAEDGKGRSKLTKINASQKYSVFDEDLYVETDSESIELKVTIHSEKLNEPQIVEVKLDLKHVEAEEII